MASIETSRPPTNIKSIIQSCVLYAVLDAVHKDLYLSLRDYLVSLHRLGVHITRQQVLDEWYDDIPNPTTTLRNNVEEIIANVIRGHIPDVPEPKTGKIVMPASAPYVEGTTVTHSLEEWLQ